MKSGTVTHSRDSKLPFTRKRLNKTKRKTTNKKKKLAKAEHRKNKMPFKKDKTNDSSKTPAADFVKKRSQGSRDSSSDIPERSQPTTSGETRMFNMADISTMLMDIKSVFKAELRGAVNKITEQISELGERTSFLEHRYDQITENLKQKEGKIDDHETRLQFLENKIEDLENRSRRANLRLRGIPENTEDLATFAKSLFMSLLPNKPEEFFRMDRIHRVAPKQTSSKRPRDVLLKLHYPEAKMSILHAAREMGPDGVGQNQIQIFPDISQTTIEKRRKMKPVTNILRSHDIQYRWAFPFGLAFRLGQKTYNVDNLQSGLTLMHKLDLSDQPNMDTIPSQDHTVRREWQEVASRKKPRDSLGSPTFSPPKTYRRISERDESSDHSSAAEVRDG